MMLWIYFIFILYLSHWEYPDISYQFFITQIDNKNKRNDSKKINKAKYVWFMMYKIMFAPLETHSIPTLLPAYTSSVLSLKGETNPPSSDSPYFFLLCAFSAPTLCITLNLATVAF